VGIFELETAPVCRRCIRQNSGVVVEEFEDECWCSGVLDSVIFVLDEDVKLSIDILDFALKERKKLIVEKRTKVKLLWSFSVGF
jgi:hypothetical protein